MSWTIHVDNMVKKATRRLYFLKQLKRSGLTSKQLFHYCIAVIRPVLEYCAPVWHYALTKSQTQRLEAIQKRAIQIVLNFSKGMPYTSMIFAADLDSLASRREISSLRLTSESKSAANILDVYGIPLEKLRTICMARFWIASSCWVRDLPLLHEKRWLRNANSLFYE